MRIIPRNEWCVHKPARTLKSMPLPAKDVWLHHGASGTSTIATANAYVKYHLGRGWADGGYSFIIAEGKVLELRGPGKVGAHTAGQNAVSHGICIAGSYSKTAPAQRDLDALRWLLSHGVSQGWWSTPKLSGGHRDAPGAVTSCPGAALHKLIGEINMPTDDDAAVLLRKAKLDIEPATWTPIPMDTGTAALRQGGYITGAPGYWIFGAYVRFSSNSSGQGIIRFVRDIGGKHDITGTQDWVVTPGKDFVTHVWFFAPDLGKPTGYEVWSSEPVTVEYAQLKGARFQ